MIKLDKLRYFLATAETEHIGKAAKILNVSPSAISHAINDLEDLFGHELFEKQGKRIYLTSHGKLLSEKGGGLLFSAEQLVDELRSDTAELQGHFRIGATHFFCEHVLTPAWNTILKDHPHLSAEIYSLRSGDVLTKTSKGELDIGVCLSPQSSNQIESKDLYRGILVLSVRKGHPLTEMMDNERMKKLGEYPAHLPKAFKGIENCETHPAIQRFNIKPKVSLMYDSYGTALESVKNSDAWTLLPDYVFDRHFDELKDISPRKWDTPYTLTAIWPSHRSPNQALKKMIEEMYRNLMGDS